MHRAVSSLAAARAPILLVGPPGRGKRWLVQALHEIAGGGPLRSIEPAASMIPEPGDEGFESLVGAALDGTLLLPALDRLPPRWQAQLAEALDHCRARVVATLERAAVPGGDTALRRDLLDRFLPLSIPPLRERAEDIVYLARAAMAAAAARAGVDAVPLGDIACARLRAHSWPGDCAEIERFAERAMALRSVESALRDVSAASSESRPALSDACESLARGEPIHFESVCRRAVRQAERGWIERVGATVAGDARRLATLLGLTPAALSVKLRDLGLPETGP